MGADFVINWIPIKKGKEDETHKKLLDEVEQLEIPELSDNTKVKIINSLENEKSEEFEEFCEYWDNAFGGDFDEDGFPIDKEDKRLTNKKMKESLKKIINEFFGCINCRDVNHIVHKGEILYISGGITWGDSPSESYEIFNKMVYLPQKILTAGGIKFQ